MKKIFFSILMLTLVMSGFAQNKNATVFDSATFGVEPLHAINSTGSDIAPALVGDKLYFCSVPEKYLDRKALERKNKAFYDIYEVTVDKDGKAISEKKAAPISGDNYHKGPVSYCPATGELVVTLSNIVRPDTVHNVFPTATVRLRLAIMKRINNQWEIKEELPFVNKKFNFAHPAISVTGDTLVFSSDLDTQSQGKSDLFMSVRKKGVWSQPQNLGNLINTPGNEMFPAFLPGGLLAFASDGHLGGYGGLDIWYTTFPNASEVKNAGSGINGPSDDFGLVIRPDEKVAYFASNRTGTGSDDIYMLNISSLREVFKGRVVDDSSNLPVAGAAVQLLGCDGKPVATASSDNQGNFRFDILKKNCPAVEVAKEGYGTERKDISGLANAELRLKQTEPFLLVRVMDKEKNESLQNVKVEVLSGEYDATSLSRENDVLRLKIRPSKAYTFYVSADGYFPKEITYQAQSLAAGEQLLPVSLEKLAVGKEFALENLYYDLNKYTLRADAMPVLDKLVKIMNNYPGLKIELGSHTDCRASSAYNLKLSQNRATAVVSYLVSKGISARRMVAKGYGETQPVNKCADGVPCSEGEYQANRRTIIKILETGK